MIRLAFVGIDHPHGAHWRELLQPFSAEAPIVAYMPGFNGATTSLEERYASAQRADTIEQLIAECEFDAAVVCLPNNEGPRVVRLLAEAGKHVLAEKPAAATADDAREMADAVRRHGIAFQNGYMWRYDDGAERLRRMVAQGQFGKLISIEISFVTSDAKRRDPSHYLFSSEFSGGGFFNWLACHQIDLLPYITGQAITAVTARVGVFGATPLEVEDGGTAIFELEGGGLATFTGGYWIPRWAGESRWSLRGSERWVHWNPSQPGTGGVLEIHGPKPQWHAMEETFTLPPDTTPGYGGYRGVALVRDWLDAIRKQGQTCRNTIESTVATLELLDLVYRSSSEGRRIECRVEAC